MLETVVLAYLLIVCCDALMLNPSADVPKKGLTLAPALSPKTTSVGNNTDIALIY
jgi:hypothetical protein